MPRPPPFATGRPPHHNAPPHQDLSSVATSQPHLRSRRLGSTNSASFSGVLPVALPPPESRLPSSPPLPSAPPASASMAPPLALQSTRSSNTADGDAAPSSTAAPPPPPPPLPLPASPPPTPPRPLPSPLSNLTKLGAPSAHRSSWPPVRGKNSLGRSRPPRDFSQRPPS